MKKSRKELDKKSTDAEAKSEQYQHQVQRLENLITTINHFFKEVKINAKPCL